MLKSVNKLEAHVAAGWFSAFLFCMFAMFFCMPPAAYADYEITELDSTATVLTTGAIDVSEQRTYNFSEQTSAIRIEVKGLISTAKLSASSVRISTPGDEAQTLTWTTLTQTKFSTDWRGLFGGTSGATADIDKYIANKKSASSAADAYFTEPTPGTWALDESASSIYIFFPSAIGGQAQGASSNKESSTLNVAIDYTATDALMAYDDVAELYMDYVPQTGDARISNIKTTFTLPVPAGVSVVPGQNVIAWGHGAAGTFEVRDDGSVFFAVDNVAAGQYCQAHIIFPRTWLTNLTVDMKWAYSGTRRDSAIAEETAWADTYSAARANAYGIQIFAAVFCIFAIALAAATYARYYRKNKNTKDTCEGGEGGEGGKNRLCTNPSAAMLGRLTHGNHRRINDFAACVAELVELGVLRAKSLSENPGTQAPPRTSPSPSQVFGSAGDLELALAARAKNSTLSKSQTMACGFLLDTVGGDFDVVRASAVLEFAHERRDEFSQFMKAWQTQVSAEVSAAGFFDEKSKRAQIRLAKFAAAIAIVAVAVKILGASWLIFAAVLVSAAVVAAFANYTYAMTPAGNAADSRVREKYHRIVSADKFDTCNSQEQLNLLIFAFQFDCDALVFDKIEQPASQASALFAPAVGRGGRREASFMQEFARALKKLGI